MKQFYLLTKTLLVAVCLLGGANSAWGENMTTMTGGLGLANNSGGFGAYATKLVTIGAGESYEYTFINYNDGASEDHVYDNWFAEIRNTSNQHCGDVRADGHHWVWPDANNGATLTDNYTGDTYTSISSNVAVWAQAYNGVTVTVTVTRSNDGDIVTVTHSATTNVVGEVASRTYSGTYTCKGFGTNGVSVILSNEKSHQDITKVVHTSASGVVTTYERKEVDLSQFTGDFCSYNAGVVTFSVTGASAVQKWCTLDLSGYYSEIPGLITDVNMTLTENITCTLGATNTGTNRLGIGIYGDTRTSFNKPSTADRNNSVTWWGIAGNNSDRIYYGTANSYVSGLTLNADTKIDVLMNMSAKTFSWYQGGTQKVNSQSFYDNTITQPKYLAVQSWSTPVLATISDMSLEIVYLSTVATIGTYGWATFSSAYALDFSKATEGLEAYMITGHEGNVVTKSQVTGTVPAGTGLLLKGAAGNYTIPVVGSSDTNVSANKLVAGTGTSISAEEGKTKYVLGVSASDKAEFQKIVSTAATVAAGKAYLQFNEVISGARALRMSFGDETAVENVKAAAETAKKNGTYLENGKIAIYKNGVKFNVAGQQMK